MSATNDYPMGAGPVTLSEPIICEHVTVTVFGLLFSIETLKIPPWIPEAIIARTSPETAE